MAEELLLPECCINYMQTLWKPKQVIEGEGEPKYSCVLAFDEGTDLSELKALLKKGLVETFGDDIPAKAKYPLKKGEDAFPGKDDKPSPFAGKMVISSATSEQPKMVRVLNGTYVPIVDHSELYAGCRVQAFVGIQGYNMKVNKGVGVYVNGIMKISDGENLEGGSRDADTMFGSAEGKADTPSNAAAPGGANGADTGGDAPEATNAWDT